MTTSIGSAAGGDRPRLTEQLAERLRRGAQRLASARRVATAADDPAGLAIARRLEARERSTAVAERNVAEGQNVVRTADSSLQTSQDVLARMRELTIAATTGTMAPVDREAIQREYDQLAAQLDQIGESVTYGGRPLLDGSAQGAEAVVIRDGDGGERSLPLPDARSQALGVSGRDVTASGTASALDAASDTLAMARARVGAADSGSSRQSEQLAAARVAAADSRSRIEDADVAQEVALTTRDRLLLGMQLTGQRRAAGTERRLLDLLG